MISPAQLFSQNPGKITDFSNVPASEIFNQTVVPRMRSLAEMLQQGATGLDEAKARRESQLQQDTQTDLLRKQADDAFLANLQKPPMPEMGLEQYAMPTEDYNAPVSAPVTDGKESIKLSNYGYASDSSPDYNSNVLRIGHSNNKLEDGVSAALTRSLAKRMGIAKGQMFEITTADGKKIQRRYDDTVPTTYKGKPLPETVDLYNTKGSNNFGGKVVAIRPITPA